MDGVAVGLGLREVWLDELERTDRRALDLLEVMIDDARGCAHRRSRWRRLGAKWPLVAHGTDLGIGDAEGVDPAYVGAIADAVAALQCWWYSEHLAFLRAGEIDLGHFGPVFDDDEAMRALSANAAVVAATVKRPLLLENPSDILGWGTDQVEPGRHLGRGYARALEAADCGALLDLTNLVYDARNGGWSTESFLAEVPMERVVQVHLAGGRQVGELWIDSHDRPVDSEALALLGEVARRAPQLRAVTIEWDEDVPSLAVALDQLEQVRSVLAKAGRR
ncbi:MAG: DUF692 family protein [Deltaproteobacteria bacterium]|nr:DUF692 family protein [Deltaproteobacteria bacterium]